MIHDPTLRPLLNPPPMTPPGKKRIQGMKISVFIRAKWRHVSPLLDKAFDVDGVNLGKVCVVWGSIYFLLLEGRQIFLPGVYVNLYLGRAARKYEKKKSILGNPKERDTA